MKKLLLVLTITLVPLMAHAQAFIEGSFGQSTVDLSAGDVGADSFDDSDTTWAIGGGYMFTPQFGVEAGYRDLGEITATANFGPDRVTVGIETTGFYIGALGRFQVADRLSIKPRAGLFIWEFDATTRLNGGEVDSASDDGSDIYFGIAAAYNITPKVEIGLGWTRFDIDGDDIDAVELKVGFSF